MNRKGYRHFFRSFAVVLIILGAGFSALRAEGATGPSRQEVSAESWALEWKGPGNEGLPFATAAEIEDFLRTAQVREIDRISEGVSKPRKLLLVKEGVRMHAIFRSQESFRHVWRSPKGLKLNFVDSCYYEVGAYRLSRLLGLDHIPPVVSRVFEADDFEDFRQLNRLSRREGTVQAWVEQAMTETGRRKKGLEAPDRRSWTLQHHMMNFFDSLIYNDDRNQGNILIDSDWKIWFIDSTRAFRPSDEPKDLEKVIRCEKGVYRRLKSLTDQEIVEELEEILGPSLLQNLLERRRRLVTHLDTLIERRTEKAVLFTY